MRWRLLASTRADHPALSEVPEKAEPWCRPASVASKVMEIPRYPPYEAGIPVVASSEIVRGQAELVDRIYRAAGVSREEFQSIQVVIDRLARYVQLLPATAKSHHRLEGGLFRMALEVGLYSLQLANASVFPTGSVERRFSVNPKWYLATLLAGMCAQLWRAVGALVVVDSRDNQWMPLLTPLYDWATENGSDVYFLRWREDADICGAQASSAFLVGHVVPPETLQYLAEGSPEVLAAMTSAIAGSDLNPSRNRIARIIAPIATQVIEEDLRRLPANYGQASIGYHLEPHLIDAMRRLVKGGQWVPNASGSVLWVGGDGTYLDWPRAAADVATVMAADAFVGVPKDPETLAEMLADAGILERAPSGRCYWTILLPNTGELLDVVVRLATRDLPLPQQFDFRPFDNLHLEATQGARPAGQSAPGTATAAAVPPTIAASVMRPADPIVRGTDARAQVAGAATRKDNGDRERKPKPRERRPGAGEGRGGEGRTLVPRAADRAPSTQEEDLPTVSPTERLFGTLKPEQAEHLRRIVGAFQAGSLSGAVSHVENGWAITQEELSAHGFNGFDLIDEMSRRDWLWRDSTKPMRKVHRVTFDGSEHLVVIIREEIAAMLGFRDKHAAA